MPATATNSRKRVRAKKFQTKRDGGSRARVAFQLTPPFGKSMVGRDPASRLGCGRERVWSISTRGRRAGFRGSAAAQSQTRMPRPRCKGVGTNVATWEEGKMGATLGQTNVEGAGCGGGDGDGDGDGDGVSSDGVPGRGCWGRTEPIAHQSPVLAEHAFPNRHPAHAHAHQLPVDSTRHPLFFTSNVWCIIVSISQSKGRLATHLHVQGHWTLRLEAKGSVYVSARLLFLIVQI